MFLKRNLVTQDTITGEKERGTVMMKGPTTTTVTIAKNDTKRAEETMGAEERKSLSAISTERIRAIGQMNAPSPSRGRKSSIDRIPSQRSQSITPHSCRN
jgi:hypothetical protein